jgi:uncharacterized protein (DUF1800 family)
MALTPLITPRRTAALVAAAGLLGVFASPLTAQRVNGVPAKADARTITHVLNRLGFGPRPGDVERVQQIGLAAYIDQQLTPDRIPNAALEARLVEFESLTMDSRELAEKYFLPADQMRQQIQRQQAQAGANDPNMTPGNPDARPQLPPEVRMLQQQAQNVTQELMQAKMLRAAMSERQLEEVLVDFWFNHFNVFIGKGQVRQYLTEYEEDVIRPHVFGSFRDLLGATAHSPAMLFYLDNFQSQAPPGAQVLGVSAADRRRLGSNVGRPLIGRGRGFSMPMPVQPPQRQQRGLNENYARELMELHTLGVDGGYTQQDVIEVARALTGWTIDVPRQGGSFMFRPQWHDAGEKTILGERFQGGKGVEEGERVLDLLARHPSTARHISFKLAQRFIADEPPKAVVDRAAKRFLDTKGDLREVTRVIITSPEFFAAEAYRAKVKTPLEFVVSAVRAANADVVDAQPLIGAMRNLGMPLYGCQPPTGYSMTADAWVNTGALLSRMNFAVQLLDGGRVPQAPPAGRGGQPPPGRLGAPGRPGGAGRPQQDRPGFGLRPNQLARAPIRVDIAALAPDTTDATRDALVRSLLAGDASATTKDTLARAETPQHLIALALGAPEFQRR